MLYTTDSHLHVEDTELFIHDAKTKQAWIRRASSDVDRDLLQRGVDSTCLLDQTAKAVITITITAAGANVTLAKGDRLTDECSERVYLVDADVTVLDGTNGTVTATAEQFGEPYNDIDSLELTNPALEATGVATEGVDHQLTLAATYRAMELVYMNYMRDEGDCYDAKRRVYKELARDEVKRTMAGGFVLDRDGDGEADHTGQRFALRRMERG